MRALVGLAVGLALFPASGCGVEGLAFREDNRVDIVQPGDRDEVRLPVTLRWQTKDLELGRPDGPQLFAVFVDQEPLRPGQHIRAVGDDACDRTPGCPDEAYLRDRHIYLTDGTSLVLDAVPDNRPTNRTGAKDRHEAVIVLLNAEGRRMGEAAFSVEFTVKRVQ